ncbi:hypothetical protein J4558_25820 [Leptolyngbya sp. 15MV]|nr:hypothetical protein J4558_25820 [Leptolyngbya sp. 15MV]
MPTTLDFPEAGHDLMLERASLRAVRGLIGWLDRVMRIAVGSPSPPSSAAS